MTIAAAGHTWDDEEFRQELPVEGWKAVSGLADTVGWWSARMPGLRALGSGEFASSADWTRITPCLSLLVH